MTLIFCSTDCFLFYHGKPQRGDARKKTNARAEFFAHALRAEFVARNTKRSIQRKEPYLTIPLQGSAVIQYEYELVDNPKY